MKQNVERKWKEWKVGDNMIVDEKFGKAVRNTPKAELNLYLLDMSCSKPNGEQGWDFYHALIIAESGMECEIKMRESLKAVGLFTRQGDLLTTALVWNVGKSFKPSIIWNSYTFAPMRH